MIFCSTLILPEISRPLMTTTLPCAGMSPASFNALEHGFISHVHLNRGSAERRIEYINILQRNCIEYVIRGLHLSSAPIISIQQFQLLVYCAVQNLATQRSSHNKSEELNDMAEALIQFSLDLATEDLGQHSDIFDISAAFSRFSVGVSLVKCAFGYLERYFRVYRNERYIHYDELMPNLFKNVLQDRGVDLVALDDVSFIVLASYTMETAKDRRLLGVSKLVDIFRIELLKCHDIISRLNREELESDLVCMNHFEGNFVFFHTDHSNETSVVQSSHPLIDRSSSLSHLVRDLQSFQMALSTTVSRVEHKWSHSYDLFVPPCCRSDRILQLAICFAEHHTTHPYSVIPKPLPSSNMREVVSVYDADLVLSLPREELFELILLGNFLGYMVYYIKSFVFNILVYISDDFRFYQLFVLLYYLIGAS